MKRLFRGGFLGLLLAALALGCQKKEAAQVESESKTVSTDAAGNETVTESEAKQVGSTVVSTTETTVDTGEGDKTTETQTVVGTVTAYEAGKKIEVLTGRGKKHDFDLDDKDTQVMVDPGVTVGNKVRLVQTVYDDGRTTINVAPI